MSARLSRRSFLRGAAASSLWAAGGCAGFPSLLSSRSPNALLTHACIGTANMAGYDLDQFLKNPQVRITALCDVDADFLAAAKKKVPDARVYRDWRELLAAEGDRLDSVNVSTPDHGHTVQISGALKAGKHVYAQKPLCKYFDECAYLRDLAAKSGKVTQLGTQMAANACDRATVEALRQGLIGPVRRVMLFSTRTGASRVARKQPVPCVVPPTLDWERWIGPAPMRPYAPGYHPLLWRMYTDFGSGWIGDLCIHVISAPWQGLGIGDAAPLAVRADVDAAALTDPSCKGCWPRYSHITWEMPGVPGSGMKPFQMEWFSGFSEDAATPAAFLPPTVCHEVCRQAGIGKLPLEGRVIEGEKGYLLVPHGWDAQTLRIVMKDGSTPPPLPQVGDAPSHFDEYVARCFDGKTARSDFAWTTRMMDAVLMGGIAERLPGRRHVWNPSTRTFDSAEANRLSVSAYRDGWTLK